MSQPLSMPPPASTRPRMLQRAQRALEARRVGAARELALWALSRRGGRDLNCFLLLAECALAEGELGQLERWGRAALALEPEHVAPYEPLARAGCVASPELRTLLERRDWPAGRRVRLEFALGHALDREGDHAGAFAAWEAANRRARVSFDPLAFQINLALSHAPLHLTGAGDPSLCPLLLIGVPRSGSSLAEQILAAHPDVQGLGERGVMGRLSARRGDAADIAAGYRAGMGVNADQVVVTDKTLGNLGRLPLLARVFPNARIVHCTRYPAASGLSSFSLHFAAGACTWSYDLEHIAAVQAACAAHLDAVRSTIGLPWHTLAYEDLCQEPERVVRELVAFCGLEWDEACLNFHRSGRAVHTSSAGQVQQPLYQASVERWRSYLPWLGPLDARAAPEGTAR